MRDMRILIEKQSKKRNIVIVIAILIVLLATAASIYVYKFKNKPVSEAVKAVEKVVTEKEAQAPAPTLQIFKGENRPIAVMIDNEEGAWPQAGLQDAYMIYEIIVEGGQTRMMAIFKDKEPTKVGPVRSSRHYFVEYAMEHGAIYSHFGWSPKAEATIKQFGVNNVNGLTAASGVFWREGTGYHTAFTSIKNLRETAKNSSYVTTSDAEPIYDYSVAEYNLTEGKEVESIKLTYSTSHNTSYTYNAEKKVFMRYRRGVKHTDRVTKEQLFAKNIIVVKVENYLMDASADKGRQELENKGTGTGVYLTNGKAIDITWKKTSATSKTYFYDAAGKEITLNDGLTFVQIVPIFTNSVAITYKPVVAETVAPATT